MRWQLGRRSTNIEDRRGAGGGFRMGGRSPFGGGGPRIRVPLGLPRGRGARGGGLGGLVIVGVVLIALFLGVDPRLLFDGGSGVPVQQQDRSGPVTGSPQEEELKAFVAVVLGDTEDTWRALFAEMGEQYADPTLVLFDNQVQSACGFGVAATGPFYCPGDQKVYLDMSFFDELAQRFGAPGDFAQAYVIAHEVGHHVQTLLGVSQQVSDFRRGASEVEANRASVMLELQADCLAGVWAHTANRERQLLEPGDVEEGLRAASAIGDDRLQRQARGYVNPDSFTHGSAEQRVRWFRRGFDSGDPGACDTFNAAEL
jgi:predicted metalloprotease